MRHINKYPAYPQGWHKKQSGAMWVRRGDTVYNAAMPLAWTELDLSAYVGTQQVWAVLNVVDAVGNPTVAFRPNGDPDDWRGTAATAGGMGCSYVKLWTGNIDPTVLVQTDANGKVEWKAGAADNVTVQLIGYVQGIKTSALGLVDGAIALGWSTLNAGAEITSESVVLLKDCQNADMGINDSLLLRPRGDAANWQSDDMFTPIGAMKARAITNTDTVGLMSITDSSGVIDIYSTAGTNADVDLLSSVSLGAGFFRPVVGSEIVFPWGAAPGSVVSTLSLSAAIGARRALVFLKVRQDGSVGGFSTANFRERGDVYAITSGSSAGIGCAADNQSRCGLVIVSTNTAGEVEWWSFATVGLNWNIEVTVLGYIPA